MRRTQISTGSSSEDVSERVLTGAQDNSAAPPCQADPPQSLCLARSYAKWPRRGLGGGLGKVHVPGRFVRDPTRLGRPKASSARVLGDEVARNLEHAARDLVA